VKTARNAMWWFWLFLFAMPLFAFLNETLPTWHWAYEYIAMLQNRGKLLELSAIEKPYTRGEVAVVLFKLKGEKTEKTSYTPFYLQLIERLVNEFQPEIVEIRSEKSGQVIKAGLYLRLDIDNTGNETAFRGMYRSRLNVQISKSISVHNALVFDRYKVDDPLYVGKKWRNMVGYTEQGYINFVKGPVALKFGRDFLRWGPGSSGTLFFSNLTRPLDQFIGSFTAGPFKYTFFTGFLDAMNVPMSEEASGDSAFYQRYVAAHRVTGRFLKGRLEVGLTEAVLYGGKNRGLDWVYFNPFVVYYDAELNREVKDNKFFNLEISGYPDKNLFLYSTLLIDDIQVEKSEPGDLEPNEIGWLLGGKWADPFQVSGLTFSGEYVRIANRTYKTPHPWETFIHRNQPLGHPLGNDFDHFQLGISKWFSADLWCRLQYEHTRKGEGSIYTPWDAPWMEYSIDQGYSEPFPTGVVEKRDHLRLQFQYQPNLHWGIQGEVVSSQYHNYQHVKGADESKVQWRIGVWWDGEWGFTL